MQVCRLNGCFKCVCVWERVACQSVASLGKVRSVSQRVVTSEGPEHRVQIGFTLSDATVKFGTAFIS